MKAPGAIVAGGASGLGAATARRLVGGGLRVVILDHDKTTGEAVSTELGRQCIFAAGDVAESGSVEAAIATAAKAPGGLRVAVNCAGVGLSKRIVGRDELHDLASFEHVLRVNLVGTFNVLRLAAATMSRNEPGTAEERGVIVNTASIAAYEPQVGQAAYAASKGGIVALNLAAARDLARIGIRVVTIAPGVFDTPLLGDLTDDVRKALADAVPFPRRLGTPDEYAELVEHIIGNHMLNGETIRLDGALRMAPR